MAQLVRLRSAGSSPSPVLFTRAELTSLFSLYSRKVAMGEWRDYALDISPAMAAFSMFRHSRERPLFTVAKFKAGSQGGGDYALLSGPRTLSRGQSLETLLAALERRLEVVP